MKVKLFGRAFALSLFFTLTLAAQSGAGCPGGGAATEERPVVAIVAMEARGSGAELARDLTDLLAWNFGLDGSLTVIGRRESARLMEGLSLPPLEERSESYWLYLADYLYADLLVTGTVSRTARGHAWTLEAYAPLEKRLLARESLDAPRAEELVEGCPGLLDRLLSACGKIPVRGLRAKFESTLAPYSLRQRILFVFPEAPLELEAAEARSRMEALFSASLKSGRFLSLYAQARCDMENEALFPRDALIRGLDPHCLATICRREGAWRILVMDPSGAELALLDPADVPGGDAASALAWLEAAVPPLLQTQALRDLRDMEAFNERLLSLKAEKRMLAKPLTLTLGQKMMKTVGTPSFYPNLNMFSLEANLFWYYAGSLGLGAGYGFSAGYPGTVDSRMAGHPLILQNEVRFYPLVYRMPRDSGLMLGAFISANAHNASEIHVDPELRISFGESSTMTFLRAGGEVSWFANLNETTVLYLNLLGLSWCLPLQAGPSFRDERSFSADLGGLGLLFRF